MHAITQIEWPNSKKGSAKKFLFPIESRLFE